MIKHNTSSVVIFQTTDYSDFTMVNGNRALNDNKIKRIIKEIQKGNNMLPYYPIQVRVVGESMEILDGQHRFFICQKLKQPVHYILVTEQKSISDIAKVNSNVEKWTPQNFVNCYVTQGNKHYQELAAFIETYKINIGTSLRLLSTGSPGTEGTNEILIEKFQHGEFEVTHLESAMQLAEECKLFMPCPIWKDRSFIIAVYKIRTAGLINIAEVAAAVANKPDMLTRKANYKAYIYNLEQIVNVGKHKRIVIY